MKNKKRCSDIARLQSNALAAALLALIAAAALLSRSHLGDATAASHPAFSLLW